MEIKQKIDEFLQMKIHEVDELLVPSRKFAILSYISKLIIVSMTAFGVAGYFLFSTIAEKTSERIAKETAANIKAYDVANQLKEDTEFKKNIIAGFFSVPENMVASFSAKECPRVFPFHIDA